jgi:hypothetical protein
MRPEYRSNQTTIGRNYPHLHAGKPQIHSSGLIQINLTALPLCY